MRDIVPISRTYNVVGIALNLSGGYCFEVDREGCSHWHAVTLQFRCLPPHFQVDVASQRFSVAPNVRDSRKAMLRPDFMNWPIHVVAPDLSGCKYYTFILIVGPACPK